MPPEPNQTVPSPEQPVQPSGARRLLARRLTKKNIPLSAVVLAVFVLLGASAGAYFGIIVPNKPENILKTAVVKQLQKKQQASKGSVSFDLKNESLKNISVSFGSAIDHEKQAFSVSLEASLAGAKLPLELRSVDKNLYVKLGSLSSVKGLTDLAGQAQASALVGVINDKLSNQWIEIDQSLLKQANAQCTTNLVHSLTQKDTDQLVELYRNNTFFDIQRKSADTVDGKAATKFELTVNNGKAEAFANSVTTLDAVKQIAACAKAANKDKSIDMPATDKAKDALKNTTIKLYAWVDGHKNLRQLQAELGNADTVATIIITFTDDTVDIQKPANPKPLLDVLGDFSQLLGGIPVGPLAGQTVPTSGLSKECEAAFQAYITAGGTTSPPTNCL